MDSKVKTNKKSIVPRMANGVHGPTKSKRNPPTRAKKNYARKEQPI